MSNYSEQIRECVSQLPFGQLFVASEVKKEYLDSIPEMTYYKMLERMVAQNELIHLTKGLYYKPRREENGIVLPSNKDIIKHYISEGTGLVIGEQMFWQKGIISDAPVKVSLLSNRIKEDRKRVGDIIVQKTDISLNDKTIPVIETLEILQNYEKMIDINRNRFLCYMREFSETYSDESAEYVIENRKYKKSTIAFLERILNWYGIENSLKKYLSPLSEYRIPSIEELRNPVPEYVEKCLQDYVEKVKEIYKEQLIKIILYGSYARGDYNDESDIDIMILLHLSEMDLKEYRHELSQVTYDFNVRYGLDIKPIAKCKEEFEKWETVYPFYQNVKREGVELFGAAL